MTGRRVLKLNDVDRDEALLGTVAALHGDTRAEFLRNAALGSAALLAALAAPAPASAVTSPADVDILNFALRFERLQASFYTEAESIGTIAKMAPRKEQWARTLGAHERAHVRIVKKILGDRAERRPFFDFHGVTETDDSFTRTAVAMEDLTVALLTGIAPRMQDRALVAALLGLLTTEARHAAWARNIVRTTPAADAFDEPRSIDEVRGLIRRTRFIATAPKVRRQHERPRLTG
jgi:hypothetical protein